MRKFVAVAVVTVAMMVVPSAAQAVITSSTVTTPANPTFVSPNGAVANNPMTVSGTATGTGNVDIHCAYADGSANASSTLASNVPVVGGNFSVQINQNIFNYYICRFIAVPTGSGNPWDVTTFQGPIVGNSYYQEYTDISGPQVGRVYDYYHASSSPEGYWSADSLGDCGLGDGYAVNPDTLEYEQIFECTQFQQQSSEDDRLKIDGTPALLPYWQDSALAGKTAVQNFTHSVSLTDGTMKTSSSEEAVTCSVPADPCAGPYQATGITFKGGLSSGNRGRTAELSTEIANSTGSAKQVTFGLLVPQSDTGWKFPGESTYTTHSAGDTIPVPGDVASFFVSEPGSSCDTLVTSCGSVTWSTGPSSITWKDAASVILHYSLSVPANGSKKLSLSYSTGYPQSLVNGFAAAAEASYKPKPPTPSSDFTIGKTKLNKKKGTATISVQVPSAGSLVASGKNLKRFRASPASAGTVKVEVAAAGKGKKKLKKKGKLKVKDKIDFTATGATASSTQTKKLTLKRKLKGKGN